jgi:hypothetical protein
VAFGDVNDAERLSRDPAMRAIVDREGLDHRSASTSEMGQFETEWLATQDNLATESKYDFRETGAYLGSSFNRV